MSIPEIEGYPERQGTMSLIHILDEATINQIAAGEVVERPSAVVKELIENAMDAGATAITAEIKEGGLSLIRITDNGGGIAKEDIPLAFLRHATSKIRSAEDLLSVTSLGFRGEALSSIAAVAQVELITKTPQSLNGFRYLIEGGEEKGFEEIGCPGGTTIIVRNIFYNTPARRKFLKTATTEAGYVSDLMERLIVSHPGISFKYIVNNQVKLQSSGNNSTKDILYHIYGRDVSRELLTAEYHSTDVSVSGFIGKPIINRGNRNFENYFINGRYIKSNVITKAIEEAYKPFLMQHKYPFTSLYFEIDPSLIDVNVHPQKLEVRLKNGEEIFRITMELIRSSLSGRELIPKVSLSKPESYREKEKGLPEPFEEKRRELEFKALETMAPEKLTLADCPSVPSPRPIAYRTTSVIESEKPITDRSIVGRTSDTAQGGRIAGLTNPEVNISIVDQLPKLHEGNNYTTDNPVNLTDASGDTSGKPQAAYSDNGYIAAVPTGAAEQLSFFSAPSGHAQLEHPQLGHPQFEHAQMEHEQPEADVPFLSKKAFEGHRIIGQVFSTFWLVEYQKELYIIDQHAAHEKVLYERIMAAAKDKGNESQLLLPPIVLTLTLREQEVLHQYEDILTQLGYEFEHFGGKEFSVRAVPADLLGLSEKELILEFLDTMAEELTGGSLNTASILEKTASLSCKAAVKANHNLSTEEASALIKELLTLENPYHCPHGRPVIISMSRYELEKKFKRIL
jgi:DNA mismatch repair protein MutL